MTDGLTVDVIDPRGPDTPARWDAFVRAGALSPVWRWEVVRAAALGATVPCAAALVSDGPRVVALAFVRLRGRRGLGAGVAEVDCPGTSALPGIALAGSQPGPLARGPADLPLLAAVVDALEPALRHAYGRGLALVWYRQVYADVLPAFLRGPTVTYAGGPVTMMRNTFASYDGYLATLAKSRRGDQRRLVRRFDDDAALTVDFGPAPPGFDTARFYALTDETSRRNHHRRFPRVRYQSVRVRDALTLDPSARLLRYTQDATMLGCGLTVDHPDVPVSSAWGALDPRHGGRSGIWFDQIARVTRWMIESGRAGIIGGKGLTDLKAEVGYQAVPQWSVARRLGR